MSAKQNGKSYFKFETNGDQEKLEALTDAIMKKVLETMQEAIVHLVDQENDKALSALQACTGELFRRAAECRKEGKKMQITDDYQG